MIDGLVRILVFQGFGEVVAKLVVPLVPGPVIGLVLLLALRRSPCCADLTQIKSRPCRPAWTRQIGAGCAS